MREKETKEYFDSIAGDWKRQYSRDSFNYVFFGARKEAVLSMIPPARGRVLDIGCGSGEFVSPLLSKGYEYYGIDISSGMIAECRKRFPSGNARFLEKAVEDMDFPDSFFDAVICVGTLEYVRDDMGALRRIRKTMKPGAVAVFTFPNASSPLTRLELLLGSFRRSKDKSFHRRYSPRAARRKLEIAGFSIEADAFVSYLPINIGLRIPFAERTENALSLLAKMLQWKSLALTYIVKAVKP